MRLPGRRADLFWNLASPGGPGEPVTQRTNRPLCILFVFIKRAQHVPCRRIRRYILARREKIHGACALPSQGQKPWLAFWNIFPPTILQIDAHILGWFSRKKEKKSKTLNKPPPNLKATFSKSFLISFYLHWIYFFDTGT